MKNRLEKYDNFRAHPWFSRLFVKLKQADDSFCLDFIKQNEHLSKDDFEKKVNRVFIDKSDKPKNWKIILEILTCINT